MEAPTKLLIIEGGNVSCIVRADENLAHKLETDATFLHDYMKQFQKEAELSTAEEHVKREKGGESNAVVIEQLLQPGASTKKSSYLHAPQTPAASKAEVTDPVRKDHSWTYNAIMLLITTRIEMEEEFNKPTQKRRLWDKISAIMASHGYHVSGHDCHVKWRNLMATYRKNVERAVKLGEETISWEFYKILHNAYGNSVIQDPPEVFLSKLMAEPAMQSSAAPLSPFHSSVSSLSPQPSSPQPDSALRNGSFPSVTEVQRSTKQDMHHKKQKICDSDEPPTWFKEFLELRRKEEKQRQQKEDARWAEHKALEKKKLVAMHSLTAALRSLVKK